MGKWDKYRGRFNLIGKDGTLPVSNRKRIIEECWVKSI